MGEDEQRQHDEPAQAEQEDLELSGEDAEDVRGGSGLAYQLGKTPAPPQPSDFK